MSAIASRDRGAVSYAEQFRRLAKRRWLYPALLAVATIIIGLIAVPYAFHFWNHTLDDDVYRLTGRVTYEHLPAALWEGTPDNRGLQRLQSWLLGFGPGLFGTPGGFRVVRAVDLIAYLTTVIPVWRWVRALDVSRPLALLAAVLSILTPWAVVASTFMTESLAYPLMVWALYFVWQAACWPTLGSLAKAGAMIFVGSLARSVLLLLGPILVLTMFVVGLHGARAAWATRATWTRRQVLPWALVGTAVLLIGAVYVADRTALDSLTGVYGATVSFNVHSLLLFLHRDVAYVVSGVGIVPGVIAAGWIGRTLLRPARPESLALAVMTIAMAFFVAYSTMRAGPDERYIMYLAPLLLVAAAVAVGRREVGAIAVALGAVFTIVLFTGVPWRQAAQSFDYYVYAANVFHARILMLNIGHHLSFTGLSEATIVALGVIVASAAVIVALRRSGTAARVTSGVLVVGLLAMGLAQMTYSNRHFTREANYGPQALAPHAWVDEVLPKGQRLGVFVTITGDDITLPALYDTWREIAFFSQAPRVVYQIVNSIALDPLGGDHDLIFIDDKTGHLRPSRHAIPPYMLQLELNPKAPLAGTVVARPQDGFVPWSLVKLDGTPRLKWLVSGNDDASFTVPNQPTSIRVYRDGGRGGCLSIGFGPPVDMAKPRPITVRSGGRSYRATLQPDGNAVIGNVKLAGGDADAFGPVTIEARGSTIWQKVPRGVRLLGIERVACKA